LSSVTLCSVYNDCHVVSVQALGMSGTPDHYRDNTVTPAAMRGRAGTGVQLGPAAGNSSKAPDANGDGLPDYLDYDQNGVADETDRRKVLNLTVDIDSDNKQRIFAPGWGAVTLRSWRCTRGPTFPER